MLSQDLSHELIVSRALAVARLPRQCSVREMPRASFLPAGGSTGVSRVIHHRTVVSNRACPPADHTPCIACAVRLSSHLRTKQRLTDINKDNQVTRAEWLCAILVLNGVCSRTLLKDILKRFDDIDTDKDGKLTVDDMVSKLASTHDPPDATPVDCGDDPAVKKDSWVEMHDVSQDVEANETDKHLAGHL